MKNLILPVTESYSVLPENQLYHPESGHGTIATHWATADSWDPLALNWHIASQMMATVMISKEVSERKEYHSRDGKDVQCAMTLT